MRTVAVLCAREDSVYKQYACVEVYDRARDARLFTGGMPVVAHPPCAQWSRLAHLARVDEGERSLGPWCVEQVRREGGVLEHPAWSRLWRDRLPLPGRGDKWGYTMAVSQQWFGHVMEKWTWLYLVGVKVPAVPFVMEWPVGVYGHRAGVGLREVSKREAEATPPAFAEWLVEAARTANT